MKLFKEDIFKPVSIEDAIKRQQEYFRKLQEQIFKKYKTNIEENDLIVHVIGSSNYYYIVLDILKNENKFYILTSYNINILKDYYLNGTYGTFDGSNKSFIYYSSLLYENSKKSFKIIKKKDFIF